MADKFPYSKWSISNLWEHFWVPEHRMPIWLLFVSDSSNCIEARIHRTLIFITRIAPLDAFIFLHLEHVYENGADSSNLIETRIHKNLIFATRIAPLDAFIFFHLAKTIVITVVFQQKLMMMLQDKNQALPGCLQLLSFLKNVVVLTARPNRSDLMN